MMNKFIRKASLITLMGLASACNDSSPERAIADLCKPGTPKVAGGYLSADGIGSGMEQRLHDLDGDLKTVEQYVTGPVSNHYGRFSRFDSDGFYEILKAETTLGFCWFLFPGNKRSRGGGAAKLGAPRFPAFTFLLFRGPAHMFFEPFPESQQ